MIKLGLRFHTERAKINKTKLRSMLVPIDSDTDTSIQTKTLISPMKSFSWRSRIFETNITQVYAFTISNQFILSRNKN